MLKACVYAAAAMGTGGLLPQKPTGFLEPSSSCVAQNSGILPEVGVAGEGPSNAIIS